jgi:hypothetical protein
MAVPAWDISVNGVGIDSFTDKITPFPPLFVNSADLRILMAHKTIFLVRRFHPITGK